MTYLQTFLTDPDLRRTWREWAHLPPSDDAVLDGLAARLEADSPLVGLLADGEARLFEGTGDLDGWLCDGETDAQTADALHALLGLLAVPRLADVHRARGIAPEISRGVCFDVGIAVVRYRMVHGDQAWGAERWLCSWWRLIASGQLYRLGRLEYHPRIFDGTVFALRHRATGGTVALSLDGILYDAHGCAVLDMDNLPPGTWEAFFYEDEDSISGFVVLPTGYASRQKVRLPRAEWDVALRPGDPVLDVHIPAGAPLDADSTRASLLHALTFFANQEAHRPRAFICHSWLLDPAWQTRLPADTRLASWARQPYLVPVDGGTTDGLYFVFARTDVDPHRTPVRTRLERAMCDALARGEALRSGGMFLLADDAPAWGQEPYRAAWPDVAARVAPYQVPD